MLKNVSSQKLRVYAWDATTGLAKTGDAANITAYITKDDGTPAATNDTNPTEVDSTNEPGYYDFDLTQAETNATKITLSPKSATSNIAVMCTLGATIYTRPQYLADQVIDSNGRIEISGTKNALDDLNDVAATDIVSAGAITTSSGAVSAVTTVGSVTGAVGSVTGNVGGNVVGSVANVTGGINTAAGTITTLDALDTAQDSQHSTTQSAISGLNNLSAADVNAEVDTALADIHLDHLLAVDYDPASKPGTSTALLNELIESDAGVSRFTANALEQAPTGGGTPQTGDAYAYLTSNLGANGANATEAGGDGDHLTAINLPDQTMNITGDITGSLSGSVGSVTGSVGSVTGAVGSVTGNVGGNVAGSVGSISGITFPTNFSDLAITVTTGLVSVGTNNDKTGYSISGTKTTLDDLNDIDGTGLTVDLNADQSGVTVGTVSTVTTVSALAANSVNASALASDAAAEIGTAFLTTTLTKGTAGTIERAFWQILKTQATIDGEVAGTPTSSAFDTDLTAADGTYDHQLILFTSGSLAGEARPIDTYVQSNGRFTLQEALTAAPSATDEFIILPDHVHPVADIQNGLATSAEIAALNDLAVTDILSDGVALNTTSGVLDVVNLVNTTTTNTDMRGTDSAFLAASAPTNFSSLVISGAGAVDSLVQGFLNNTIAETTADNIAANFETFFDNADAITASVIDDVGSGGGGGGDATAANQTTIITHLTDIKGTGFVKDTHSLVNIEGYVDVIDDGTSGLVKIASDVAAILVDTNELQTDWTNGGRLDTLLDTAAGSGAGSGARTVTITVDDGTDPLQNAIVRMTEGVNTYRATSNASGIAVFNLDDATYTVAISKSGYTYAGTSLVVDGDETATYSMSAIVFSAPDNADMTLGYFTVYDITGAALASETITYKQTTNVSGYGTSFEPDSSTLTSDANGLVQVNLYKGANYAFTRTGSKAFTVTIPDDAGDSYELPNML